MLEGKMPGLDSRATVPGPMISLSGAWRGRWRQTDLRQAPATPRTSCVILDKSLNSLGTVSSSIKWADRRTRSEGLSALVRMQRMRAITTQHSLRVSHYYPDAVSSSKSWHRPRAGPCLCTHGDTAPGRGLSAGWRRGALGPRTRFMQVCSTREPGQGGGVLDE